MDLSSVLSFVVAICGAIATVFATIMTDKNGFYTAFISSLVMEIIVLYIWGKYLHEKKQFSEKEKSLNKEIENITNSNKEIDDIIKEERQLISKEREDIRKQLNSISLAIKNNSIHNNELIVKIPSKGDESYQTSELISKSQDLSKDDKRNRLLRDANHYSNELFDVFKKYCADMLREIIKLEEGYLAIKGYNNLKISSTIKLFDKPYIHNVDIRTSIKIYTAFRDKDTYEDKNENGDPKREIGLRTYTIDGNDDFTDCLSRDYFFINNATRDTNNYRNEHEDFDAFYNCAIVVPIRVKLPDGNKKFLGYLCCDCKNDSPNKEEIFDKGSAQYLFSFAQNFATFLETLNSNWSDRFSDHTQPDFAATAVEMIYRKIYCANT